MTAPTAWPGTDLDSIVFSDEEHGEACEWGKGECGAEALYAAVFALVLGDCTHPRRVLFCLLHKDRLLERDRANGVWKCPECPGSRFCLKRIEAIR